MTAHRPVRLRLEGFPADIAATAEEIARTPGLTVTDRSRLYPNRRGNPARGRVYLEVLPAPDHDSAPRPGGDR